MDLFQNVFNQYQFEFTTELAISIVALMLEFSILFIIRMIGRIDKIQTVAWSLTLIWLFLIFGSTIFFRTKGERQYQLELFWSWKELIDHKGRAGAIQGNGLLLENILNVCMMVPIGFLLPFDTNKTLKWWQGLVLGAIISVIIEVLQLALCGGLFEFDDIVHNSIGCMIGCIACDCWKKKHKVIEKWRNAQC
jgi:glycopeptide antibiotics resistance protein